MFVPPDDAVNENGRLDFWYPADSLTSAEVKQLIQTIAPMATMDGINIPENLFQLLQKREYKDVFSPPVYLSCDALLACLQRFYQAVDELARTKGFVLIDVAVGKTSPSKYKAKHTGTFFNSKVSIEGNSIKQENTPVGNFLIPDMG
ncbi:hypothetical protein [Legionella sp. km772]|uniref:hypothetical protein n=1 Tax=Legionella sp. km772 TaxID=2498111 RepID=UPI000F8E1BFA|nr:hypothetical protein [Legionella sp. km772]RUR10685.1 hypothetical protein ELY15_07795 [Legionella sp. km772]